MHGNININNIIFILIKRRRVLQKPKVLGAWSCIDVGGGGAISGKFLLGTLKDKKKKKIQSKKGKQTDNNIRLLDNNNTIQYWEDRQ